ncbi:MAG: BadF/BadG/BcrA/BcrD ATPase family protein, partial [Verrucomicrobiota bacterium]
GQGHAGPTNPNRVSVECLARNLDTCIREALHEARIEASEVKAACIGLAGASSPLSKTKIQAALGATLFAPSTKIQFTTDAAIALFGAHLGQPGIIVIAGTGSICFGLDSMGGIHRSGGLGPQEKDGGSAKWIHQQLIEKDAGLSALAARLNARNRSTELVCPEIFQEAEAGDPEATQIIDSGAEALHALVETVDLNCAQTSLDLSLLGGTLYSGSPLRKALCQKLSKRLPTIRIKPATLQPAAGAVYMARLLDETVDPNQSEVIDEFIARLASAPL